MAARVLNYKSPLAGIPVRFCLVSADIYIGMELAVIPVFQAEMIPTPIRGFAVGSYQFSLMVISFLVL